MNIPPRQFFCKQTLGFLVYVTKVLMRGKLIAVAYSLHIHIETSSLLEVFVNKNRCISVRLVSEEDFYPQFNFEHFDNSIKVSYDQNISLFFFHVKNGSHVFTSQPGEVHCSIKNAYTSEITFLH